MVRAPERTVYTVQCTGSFVSTQGDILSAGHCVDPSDPDITAGIAHQFLADLGFTSQEEIDVLVPLLSVEDVDQSVYALQPAGVQGTVLPNTGLPVEVVDFKPFKSADLALLRLANFDAETPALPVAAKRPDLGTPVRSIGYPGSVQQVADASRLVSSSKDGTASSYQTRNGVPFTEVSAPITYGMSGGPTLNGQGEIIGVNSFRTRGEPQPFNFITDTRAMNDFLKSNNVDVTAASAPPGGSVVPVDAPDDADLVRSDPGIASSPWLPTSLGVVVLALTAVITWLILKSRRSGAPTVAGRPTRPMAPGPASPWGQNGSNRQPSNRF